MPVRVTARPGLLSRQYREGTFHVREGVWTAVDAENPEIRKVLVARVPRHVRIGPGQDAELTAAGLALKDNVLVDLRADAKKKDSAKPAKT